MYPIVLIFYRGMCKSGKDPEILNACRLAYLEQEGVMFQVSLCYAHLHKSKIAAVGHLEFLTWQLVKLALEPHVIPHF